MKILPGRTAKLEAFVAPARARPQLWRLAAGATLATLIWIAFTAGLLFLGADLGATGGRTLLLGFLGSFAGLALGAGARGEAAAAPEAGQPDRARRLPTRGLRYSASRCWRCSPDSDRCRSSPWRRRSGRRALAEWAAWLPLALPLILLQAGAEELAFRGYLMQGARGPLPFPLGVVGDPGGRSSGSCTGARRSSARTRGSSC